MNVKIITDKFLVNNNFRIDRLTLTLEKLLTVNDEHYNIPSWVYKVCIFSPEPLNGLVLSSYYACILRLQTSVTINKQLKLLSSFSANFHLWRLQWNSNFVWVPSRFKCSEIFWVLCFYARRMDVILKHTWFFAPKSVGAYKE